MTECKRCKELEEELAQARDLLDMWQKKFTLEKQMRKDSDERADDLEQKFQRGDYHPKGCGCSDTIEKE